MARISNQSIENVRAAADIVSVIGGYIELVKRGKDFKGKCPFHNDSRPSLSVEPNKQCWRCFTCDIGGNVFKFVEKYENVSFPDAVKILARNVNVELKYDGNFNEEEKDFKDEYIKMQEIAEKHYHDLLINSANGKKALDHLQNDRGLSLDTIKEFNIGFAYKNKDDLLKLLEKKSYSIESMKQSSLVKDSEKWGDYDYFRSRIMFPWRNYFKELLAFQGRRFPDYLEITKFSNTKDTRFFTKGKILWGLDKTKKYIIENKSLILVEGQMDLVQLYENGIKNVAAIGGTSFTPYHATIVKNLSENIFILMDGDKAGKEAAIKHGYLLFSKGVEAKIIIPPDSLDPDDWIKRDKASVVLSTLEKSKNVVDTHYEIFMEKSSGSILENNNFIDESLGIISKYDDPIVIKLIIKRIAKLTDIPEVDISAKLDKKGYKPQVPQSNKKEPINEKELLIYDDLISLCCSNNLKARTRIFNNLKIDWIESKSHRDMYDKIYIHLKSEGQIPVSLILDQLEDEKVKNTFNKITFNVDRINPTHQMAADILRRLEREIFKKNREYLVEELKNAPSANEEIEILEKISKIDKQILDLKNKYNE